MLDFERLEVLASEVGFTYVAPLDAATIVLRDEVRDMCVANTCGDRDYNSVLCGVSGYCLKYSLDYLWLNCEKYIFAVLHYLLF